MDDYGSDVGKLVWVQLHVRLDDVRRLGDNGSRTAGDQPTAEEKQGTLPVVPTYKGKRTTLSIIEKSNNSKGEPVLQARDPHRLTASTSQNKLKWSLAIAVLSQGANTFQGLNSTHRSVHQ